MTDMIPLSVGELKMNGLTLVSNLDVQEYKGIGHKFRTCQDSVMWWLGDWINYGRHTYGEKYTEIMRVFNDESPQGEGYQEQTFRAAAYVCARVPLLSRDNKLTFQHHRAVARFEDQREIQKWLKRARENSWTVEKLRAEIKASEAGPEAGVFHTVKADFDSSLHMMVSWFDRQEDLQKWPVERLEAVREKLDEGLGKLTPWRSAIVSEIGKRRVIEV